MHLLYIGKECISRRDINDIISTKLYDKRDDFYFKIVNFPFSR